MFDRFSGIRSEYFSLSLYPVRSMRLDQQANSGNIMLFLLRFSWLILNCLSDALNDDLHDSLDRGPLAINQDHHPHTTNWAFSADLFSGHYQGQCATALISACQRVDEQPQPFSRAAIKTSRRHPLCEFSCSCFQPSCSSLHSVAICCEAKESFFNF